jgi:hypothetical protein
LVTTLTNRYGLRETDTGGQTVGASSAVESPTAPASGVEWDNRIIIPMFHEGRLFSYVACDYTGTSPRKVLSGPNGPAQGALFYAQPGDDAIPTGLPVGLGELAIVEGCWDALKVSMFWPTVAILGCGGKHGMATAQLSRILRATSPGTVIAVLLDPDAKSKAHNVYRQLKSVRPRTHMLTPALDADPCDTPYDDLLPMLHALEEVTSGRLASPTERGTP